MSTPYGQVPQIGSFHTPQKAIFRPLKLKALRVESQHTQRELAKESGLSHDMVGLWERDCRRPGVLELCNVLWVISRRLNRFVPVDAVFEYTNGEEVPHDNSASATIPAG